MNKLNKHKRIFVILGLFLLFVVLMGWTTRFSLFTLEDLRLFIILISGTLILILLSTSQYKGYKDLQNKLRFNLFLTSMLMVLILLYRLFSIKNAEWILSQVVVCLKPMIMALVIYLPSRSFLEQSQDIEKHDHPSDFSKLNLLSRREKEVFELAVKGQNNKEIGQDLYIAEATVKKHMQNIFKKLECNSRGDLAFYYSNEKIE